MKRITLGELKELYDAIAHGDALHRFWLMDAMTSWHRGDPIPEAKGGSDKDKRIYELEQQIELYKKELQRVRMNID